MKLPKEVKRYCPYCRKHTEQLVSTQKQKARSAAHPMSRGSATRVKSRSLRGIGNWGKLSKMGVKDRRSKVKTTKRITIMYKCKVCNKQKGANSAVRVSRIVIGEKVTK